MGKVSKGESVEITGSPGILSFFQPITHALDQLRDIQRFGDMPVHSRFMACRHVLHGSIGGQGDDRDGVFVIRRLQSSF